MTERATRQYHFTNPFVDGGTWQDGLRNHFRKMHLVFRENPVLCELILMRTGELSPKRPTRPSTTSKRSSRPWWTRGSARTTH